MREKGEILLAAFGQLNRNDDFKIITKIIGRESGIVVRKQAYTKKSIPHIQRLKTNHDKLAEKAAPLSNIQVARIMDSGSDFIEFEYIKGRNVEYEVFNLILNGNYDMAIGIIDNIFEFMDGISSNRSNVESEDAKKINDIYRLPTNSVQYASPGLIDLNLDNFILSNDSKLVAFDCEWVFDNPIPLDFIKTRLLHTFFARRSEAFAYLPNKKRQFKYILESGNMTLIPVRIYSRYSDFLTKEAMKKYWKAEDIFQNSVSKYRLDTAKKSFESFTIGKVQTPKETFPEIEESIRNNYTTLLASYESMQSHTKEVENELANIKSSTAYNAARKVASAKRKIHKKLLG